MGLPAGLKPRHGLQNEIVEAFRPGPVQGNIRWRKDPPQATAMPVAPPDPGRALRAAPVAAVHSPERNPADPARPPGALATRLVPASQSAPMPPRPGAAERTSFRDTRREQCPGGGVSGPGWVRSAVVGDSREPGSGEARELAAMATPGVAAAVGEAGR